MAARPGEPRGPEIQDEANSLRFLGFLLRRLLALALEAGLGRTLLLMLLALSADGAFAAEGDEAEYRRGLESLHAGRLQAAQDTAVSLLKVKPMDSQGRQLLGLVKLKRGDLPGALSEFDRALAKDPAFIPAREERAVTLARLGEGHRARADLEALKIRAAACANTCPPELRPAVSRVEAALAAGKPPKARKSASVSAPPQP
jgi:predicted Zn-dependent protease